MAKENKVQEEKTIWGKLESLAKILAGLGAILGAVLIPIVLNKQAEENRKVQVYAQIMSQREAKDTDIRAKMFETLLSKYLTISSEGGDISNDIHERIVFLRLLINNFQEYFSAKPLFEDLYRKITIERERCKKNRACGKKESAIWKGYQDELVNSARSSSSKQITMLSRVGLVSDKINIREQCESSTYIPLFEIKEKGGGRIKEELDNKLKILEMNKRCENPGSAEQGTAGQNEQKGWWEDEGNITLRMNARERNRNLYAISIRVEEVMETDARVSVSLYRYALEKEPQEIPQIIPVKKEPFLFSVSYFDMPYTDNTRLFEGDRFAIVVKAICKGNWDDLREECRAVAPMSPVNDSGGEGIRKEEVHPFAILQVITFKEEFMTLRDRPLFEEMINKLQKSD